MRSRTAVVMAMLMLFVPCGCAHRVQTGLSNAPALGGATAEDTRVHDVIANGRDSCGRRLDPGPLRHRIPPCPRLSRPAADPALVAPAPRSDDLVTPWLEHFYTGWPCRSLDETDIRNWPLAWSYSPSSARACGIR